MPKKRKCGKVEVKKSKKFKGMYAIHVNGKVFDEPHASERLANNQIKRFKSSFGCK